MALESAERASFEHAAMTHLDMKIMQQEEKVQELAGNLAAPDFYEGDRAEVEATRSSYERELRLLHLRRDLASLASPDLVAA